MSNKNKKARTAKVSSLNAEYDSLSADNNPIDESQLDQKESSQTEDYLLDDERVLAGDDVLLHEDLDSGIFQQESHVISWEVLGLLKENGKPRNRLALRNDPPLFVIKSASGDEVEFVLTKELSKSLSVIFTNVHNAYIGINSLEKNAEPLTFKNSFNRVKSWIKTNPVKSTIVSALILLMVIPNFI